jgi:hydrogenase nickel incorporation protein HypA/HybF
MHELSIAMSILDIAQEEAEQRGNPRVEAIHLKIGQMSGIVKEALLAAYELASEQTPFAQARLVIEEVPGRELQISAMELAE